MINGMVCAKCDVRMRVAQTINKPFKVVRLRYCPKCRRYIWTKEIISDKKG